MNKHSAKVVEDKEATSSKSHPRGKDRQVIARPVADFDLTPEEIAMLPDPRWVTEDDADAIVSIRREKSGAAIPLTKVLKDLGYSVDR